MTPHQKRVKAASDACLGMMCNTPETALIVADVMIRHYIYDLPQEKPEDYCCPQCGSDGYEMLKSGGVFDPNLRRCLQCDKFYHRPTHSLRAELEGIFK